MTSSMVKPDMADTSTLRQRAPAPTSAKHASLDQDTVFKCDPRFGLPMQSFRGLLCALYILTSSLCIHAIQLLGAPLYFVDRELYYTFMAVTKQHFTLVLTTTTQWWSPTLVRISGDDSMQGQLRQLPDGRFEADFPERMLLIANHQIYTDWLYLWWVAYTAGIHGHVYIVLKQSLKWIPLFGPAMQFYSFIFLARKWSSDQQRIAHRLDKLKLRKKLGAGTYLDPMWLLVFPEGTNLSANTRRASVKWAEKTGIPDMRNCLLPRSTGLQYCLDQLGDSLEYVYDCTIAYEHIPPGQFGQDLFTLRAVLLQGRPPKSVNMHWRRFRTADIPVNDREATEAWLLARWREKDDLLDHHLRFGRFPASESAVSEKSVKTADGYIETQVRQKGTFEFLQIYLPIAVVVLLGRILLQLWRMVARVGVGG